MQRTRVMRKSYGASGRSGLSSVASPWRSNERGSMAIVLVAAGAATATAGALLAINPSALFAALVAIVAAIAISRPAARFAIVIAGGLFVLGTSGRLDDPKLLYLVWVAICAVLAVARTARTPAFLSGLDARGLFAASFALWMAIGLSLAVAMFAGTPMLDSVRDAAPYGLLAVAPLLAPDVARSSLGPYMPSVAAIAGLIASIGFAVDFLSRRGLAEIPLVVGTGSVMLSAFALVVAIAALLSRSPRPMLWAMVAAVVAFLLFVTGTRSAFVLLVGPAAMVFAGAGRVARLGRLTGAVVVVGTVVLGFSLAAVQGSMIDIGRVTDRLGSILGLATDLAADQSYIERARQVGAASSALTASPVAGVGLGYRFEWARFTGESVPSYTIDTGLSTAAKFGFVGLSLLGVATTSVFYSYRKLRHQLSQHVRLSFVGFVAVSIAMLPLGNPFEDKGFGLAVGILIAWMIASAESRQRRHLRDRREERPKLPSSQRVR